MEDLYGFFQRWKKKGGITTVQDRLCDEVRQAEGREDLCKMQAGTYLR